MDDIVPPARVGRGHRAFARVRHALGIWAVNSQYAYFDAIEVVRPKGAAWLADRLRLGAIKDRFVRRLEGWASQDVFPTWYRLNTAAAIRCHARNADLAVERLDMRESIPSSMRDAPWFGIVELLVMWSARKLGAESWRSNIVAVLRKPGL